MPSGRSRSRSALLRSTTPSIAATRSPTPVQPASKAVRPMTAGGDDSGSDPLAELLSSRFTLRRLLATGGMANVYEAHDLVTDRVGALKLLRPDSRKFPDAVERLS